ncbi:PAS domain-containing hybrid sensor histidine kinase/response regulator [Pontibacter sp. SGAir0037]|uniref:PAS domain-containing hybrid sensor histidine kinase/response regulator n=1 Tax=Pontibacter sp. SGAir0037 TaxID=2571030 RepID=UPI0010F4A01C|nr:response regulator [Pontibacter sp. SGAir0037]
MKVLKERIEEIITLIAEVANGNFDYEIEASETGDELDALISGISMLGQELKSSTVSRDFMQSIYKGVVDVLLVLNKDFTIRNVNEACEDLFGCKENELRGLHLTEVLDNPDKQGISHIIKALEADGKYMNADAQLMLRKQNRLISVSSSFSYLLNNRQEVDGILIIAKDISELKQKELELKEAKTKAEAANEAKSNFLSSMSHEIRTPLNGIMGFTNLLMETELNPDQEQYVRLINTSGIALTKLLSDILDLHKIEQDKITVEHIPFNIRESITSNLEPYKHLAQSKGLSLTCAFDALVPEVVQGDPTRINQVLINLVSNAIKFTSSGSIHVEIKAGQRTADSTRIPLICTVTDTGIGIPPEKQGLIFDSFTQSDQSTNRKYGGFGLGLAISKKLVNLMQGGIEVLSPLPGLLHGSQFKFTVDVEAVPEAGQMPSPTGPVTKSKLEENVHFLVVDDNELNRMLLENVLKGYGAFVTTARSGEEALQLSKTTEFSLVFMDLQMPEMDGFEATRLLRTAGFTNPIIAFSANVYQEDIQKSLMAGMNDHLSKPFYPSDLDALLQKWMPYLLLS